MLATWHLRTDKIPSEREGVDESGHNIREQTQERTFPRLTMTPDHLCLLFIHPRAQNLIGLRSVGTMPV